MTIRHNFLKCSFFLALPFFIGCTGSGDRFTSDGGFSETEKPSAKLEVPVGNGDGYSGIVDTTGPATPVNFSGIATNAQIAVSWASGSSDTSGYVVVRRASSPVAWAPTAGATYSLSQDLGNGQTVFFVGTDTSKLDSKLSNGIRYHYKVVGYDAVKNYSSGATTSATPHFTWVQDAYLKAPNAESLDLFGYSVSVSSDTAIVGAYLEDSNQTTITNGTFASGDNGASNAGAAYIFRYTGKTWAQEAYLKAPNADSTDVFGMSVAISSDTAVVGAYNDDSNQTTVTNGTTASGNNSVFSSGAAYVFRRTGTTWAQEAYLKPPNPDIADQFGISVSISSDTVVVGAAFESSGQTTITNGTSASNDNSASGAGAVYVFKRTGTVWAQEAYLKAPNAEIGDIFGYSVAASADTIVVGAYGEDSNQTTITNGTTASADNSASMSGAAYVFKRTGTTWAQEAYLKASNANSSDQFGISVAVSSDTVAVGAASEGSNQTTITNDATASSDNSAFAAGAVYIFKRIGTTWVQEAYLKASNAEATDNFGISVAVESNTVVVGAYGESSNQNTISSGTSASNVNSASTAGAVYVFKRTGSTWEQEAYLKAPNAEAGDWFGRSVSISSDTIVVGAHGEDSNQNTVRNDTTASNDNSASAAGAAYVFKRQ